MQLVVSHGHNCVHGCNPWMLDTNGLPILGALMGHNAKGLQIGQFTSCSCDCITATQSAHYSPRLSTICIGEQPSNQGQPKGMAHSAVQSTTSFECPWHCKHDGLERVLPLQSTSLGKEGLRPENGCKLKTHENSLKCNKA